MHWQQQLLCCAVFVAAYFAVKVFKLVVAIGVARYALG